MYYQTLAEELASYFELLPPGWGIAFGDRYICDILCCVLNMKQDEREEFQILQLKEKFGKFKQYYSYYTPELRKIIQKYEDLSQETCVICGKHSKIQDTDTLLTVCEKHTEYFTSIKNFL